MALSESLETAGHVLTTDIVGNWSLLDIGVTAAVIGVGIWGLRALYAKALGKT